MLIYSIESLLDHTNANKSLIFKILNKTNVLNLQDYLSSCWIFSGCLNHSAYGIIRVSGKYQRVHRIIAQTFKRRQLTSRDIVMHRCDNPQCVNPWHLRIGSHQDNDRDRDRKGRQAKGSKQGNTKLLESDVELILSDLLSNNFDSLKQLSVKYNTSATAVSHISRFQSWKHVSGKLTDLERKQIATNIKSKINSNKIGTKNPNSKLTERDIQDIHTLTKSGTSVKNIALKYNVAECTIYQYYKTRRHLC